MAKKETEFGISSSSAKANRRKQLKLERQAKNRARAKNRQATRENVEGGIGVVKVVFLLLIVFSVFAYLRDDESSITFNSLLDIIGNAPQISLDWLDWTEISFGDWGILNPLRNLLSTLIDLVNVLCFLGTGLVQAVLYLLYFLWFLLL